MSQHFETLARLGYGARGIVYLVLGGLATASAIWGGSEQQGTSEALEQMLTLPFGRILLAAVALGLFGHILWRLAQGLLNAEDLDDDAKGFATRIGYLASAGGNLFLALSAAGLAIGMGGGGGGGGSGEERASGWLLQQPFGPWLLGAVGIAVVGAGLAQVWRGITRGYAKTIDLPQTAKPVLDPLCRFGIAARGALLAVIGGFLIYGALTVSPEQAGGTADALAYIRGLPFGAVLYAAAALGLFAYGGYSITEGLYRRIETHKVHGKLRRAVS